MRWIGLDYGSARIGIALGDDITRIASPWETLPNTHDESVLFALKQLCKKELAEGIVIGMPRLLKDTTQITEQQKEINQFIQQLKSIGLPVEIQDETFSSVEAAKQQREIGGKGKRDDLAAAIILQSFLDRK